MLLRVSNESSKLCSAKFSRRWETLQSVSKVIQNEMDRDLKDGSSLWGGILGWLLETLFLVLRGRWRYLGGTAAWRRYRTASERWQERRRGMGSRIVTESWIRVSQSRVSVVGEFGSSAESALVEKHPTFGLCFCFVLLSCLRNKSACHSPSKEDGDFDVERKINLSRVFRQDKAKHRKFGEAYTPEIVG